MHKALTVKGALEKKYYSVIAVFFTGIVFSAAMFGYVGMWEKGMARMQFEEEAHRRIDAIEYKLKIHLNEMDSIAEFYASSQKVERAEFHEFIRHTLRSNRDIMSLQWIPKVTEEERGGYEEAAKVDGYGDYKIRELDAQGFVVPTEIRREYYPVFYSVPFEEAHVIIGFDISSDPLRWQAAQMARDSGLPAVAGPFQLFGADPGATGYSIFMPVYRNDLEHGTLAEKRENLAGFVSSLFRIEDLINEALNNIQPAGLDIYIYDIKAEGGGKLLHTHYSRLYKTSKPLVDGEKCVKSDLSVTSDFDFGVQKWRIECLPCEIYIASHSRFTSLAALVAGILLTFIFTKYIFDISIQGDKIGSIVKERTLELIKVISSLNEAKSELLLLGRNAAIGKLAGGVAHEMNNPLTGVLNGVQLVNMMAVEKKDFNFADFKEEMDMIEKSAVRCKDLARSFLDFSRFSIRQFELLSVNVIVEKIVSLFAEDMRGEKIDLKMDLEPGLPLTMGDAQLLGQILIEILSNARWAIKERSKESGGRITIETIHDPVFGNLQLFISDSGIGISRDNINRVFEPFFTTKPAGEGSGLGLAVAQSIVKHHKGTIEAQSEAGRGSTFKITLPVVRA